MTVRRRAVLLAVLPLLCLASAQVWLGQRFAAQLAFEERIRAQDALESHAAAVQRSIDRIVEKLDGLAVFVAGQSVDGLAVDSVRFGTFAAGLHASSTWIRAFQVVSGGVITHVYPLKGNEAVLGFNLLTAPPSFRGGDVHRAWRSGRVTVTGPIELIQGGLGIIVRQPIAGARDAPARLVGIVLNIAPLLAESGVSGEVVHDMRFALRNESGEVFFGQPAVFEGQPVVHRISLPDGSWELAGIPGRGWQAATGLPVLLFHLAGSAIVVLLSLLVYVLALKRENLAAIVRERTVSLRESEQKYRELVENANSIILRWDATGRIVFINEFGQRFFGYAADEMLGRHVMDTIVPRTESGGRDLQGLIDEIRADPKAFEQNINENVRRNGERVWIAWTNRIVLDAEDRPVEILSVGTDITERRHAEEEVRRLNEELEQRVAERTRELAETMRFLDAILDNIPNPVFWKDAELRYAGCNRAYEKAFNVSREDLVGKTVLELEYLPEDDRRRYHEEQAHLLAEGGTLRREAEMPFADGRAHQTLFSVSGFRKNDGAPGGVVAAFTDITALKETEAALARAMQAAEAADRVKSAFLATMSHELRTPLNSIIGFTGLVLQELPGRLNDEQKKQLGMVRDSARHLLALINDVLDISKIEAGELTVAREPFDLGTSIDKVAGIVAPLAEKKGLALRVEGRGNARALTGDARRVEQILLNLLSNAIKFTEAGAVTLSVEPAGDYIVNGGTAPVPALRVRVADTGIGIKAEDMAQLFMPFRQVDSAITRQHEGTGLGLAICRRLAALMGGAIEAETRFGEGSVFTVTLPLDAETETQ